MIGPITGSVPFQQTLSLRVFLVYFTTGDAELNAENSRLLIDIYAYQRPDPHWSLPAYVCIGFWSILSAHK